MRKVEVHVQKEFQSMFFARKVLERLDNKAIDGISLHSQKSDYQCLEFFRFDFHSSALALFLKTTIATNLTKILIGNEFRRVFGSRKDDDNSIHQL